jgi:hypothetical protein
MSKIFVNIGLSLDGYMAPEGMTMERGGPTQLDSFSSFLSDDSAVRRPRQAVAG